MKKVAMIGFFLALTAMTGCHKDDDTFVECRADSFLMHCEEGRVVSCVVDAQTHRGRLHSETSFVLNAIEYVCAAGEVVIANQCVDGKLVLDHGEAVDSACGLYGTVACYDGHALENVHQACDGSQAYPNVSDAVRCADGQLMVTGESGDTAYGEFMCDQASGDVYHCDAENLVRHAALCSDASAVSCVWDGASWRIDKTDCSQDETCVEYEKGSSRYASCFNRSNVGDACGEVGVYGKCDNDSTLVVCSSDGEGGRLLRIDCQAQGVAMGVTRQCGLVEDSGYGYDCRTVCEDSQGNAYDEFGTCTEGQVLHYCNQKGEYAEPIDCQAQSMRCGWSDAHNDFDCI